MLNRWNGWKILMAAGLAAAVIIDTSGLSVTGLWGKPVKPSPAAIAVSSDMPPFSASTGKWQAGGVNVKNFSAKGDGVANDTAAIQAAIDSLAGGGTVSFPKAVYVAKNLYLRAGVTLDFEPGTVLKFPPGSDGTDRMIIVGQLDGGKFTQTDKEKEYIVKGNGLDIDATALRTGHTCYGIFVSGAKNFTIQDVQGHGFQNGYLLEIIRSYGDHHEFPQNGHVKNIRNFGKGWGCVAIETGGNLVIEEIYSDTNGVNIECDVDVMGHGVLAVWNVTVRNVAARGGTALNINAHQAEIDGVKAYNLKNFHGTLVGLFADTTPGTAGSIRNVTIDTGFGDGGGTADSGIDSPNDVVVGQLVGRNIVLQNYREFGFKANGGDWYNCSAKNNGLSGWKSTAQPGTIVPLARFFSCEAIDNNKLQQVNHSGWNYAYHTRLEFYNCTGTDTRAQKRQWYAVFSDATILVNSSSFDGNKIGSIAPLAKAVVYN